MAAATGAGEVDRSDSPHRTVFAPSPTRGRREPRGTPRASARRNFGAPLTPPVEAAPRRPTPAALSLLPPESSLPHARRARPDRTPRRQGSPAPRQPPRTRGWLPWPGCVRPELRVVVAGSFNYGPRRSGGATGDGVIVSHAPDPQRQHAGADENLERSACHWCPPISTGSNSGMRNVQWSFTRFRDSKDRAKCSGVPANQGKVIGNE